MANVALTAAKIAPVYTDPGHCEMYQVTLTEAVTAGQVLCWAAAGTMSLADGNDAALDEPQAVAMQAGSAGARISVLRRGCVYGFTVAALSVGGLVTLTDTPGVIEEAGAGEHCGRIWALPDTTRVIYFEFEIDQEGIG